MQRQDHEFKASTKSPSNTMPTFPSFMRDELKKHLTSDKVKDLLREIVNAIGDSELKDILTSPEITQYTNQIAQVMQQMSEIDQPVTAYAREIILKMQEASAQPANQEALLAAIENLRSEYNKLKKLNEKAGEALQNELKKLIKAKHYEQTKLLIDVIIEACVGSADISEKIELNTNEIEKLLFTNKTKVVRIHINGIDAKITDYMALAEEQLQNELQGITDKDDISQIQKQHGKKYKKLKTIKEIIKESDKLKKLELRAISYNFNNNINSKNEKIVKKTINIIIKLNARYKQYSTSQIELIKNAVFALDTAKSENIYIEDLKECLYSFANKKDRLAKTIVSEHSSTSARSFHNIHQTKSSINIHKSVSLEETSDEEKELRDSEEMAVVMLEASNEAKAEVKEEVENEAFLDSNNYSTTLADSTETTIDHDGEFDVLLAELEGNFHVTEIDKLLSAIELEDEDTYASNKAQVNESAFNNQAVLFSPVIVGPQQRNVVEAVRVQRDPLFSVKALHTLLLAASSNPHNSLKQDDRLALNTFLNQVPGGLNIDNYDTEDYKEKLASTIKNLDLKKIFMKEEHLKAFKDYYHQAFGEELVTQKSHTRKR